MSEQLKTTEERRGDILAGLDAAQEKYADDAPQLADLQFYFEEGLLGNDQAFLLRIGKHRLTVKRNEDASDLLSKLEDFLVHLNVMNPVSAKVISKVSDVVEPLTEGREKTYWRDVVAEILKLKAAFPGTAFATQLAELRALIHSKSLGQGITAFQAAHGDLTLEIQQNDDEATVLSKLSHFIKGIKNLHPDKFELGERRVRTPESTNRNHAWAQIYAGVASLKKAFKGTDFGDALGELKAQLDRWSLGQKDYRLESKWGNLSIKQGEGLDEIITKLATFIEAIQRENSDLFDDASTVSAHRVIQEKEVDQTYWRDVIAGLDALQDVYPSANYPAIEKLKKLIEEGKLGKGGPLIFSIGPVILDVEEDDNDKIIKRKVSVFIGELKQMAPKEDKLDDLYWRDLLAELRGMEDAFGDQADYQMLMMSLEMGVLATTRDLKIDINGASLELKMRDTDSEVKRKISNFISELKTIKRVQVDEEVVQKYKAKIENLEEEAFRREREYRELIQELSKDGMDKQRTIEDLANELRIERQRHIPTPQPAQPSYQYRPTRSYSG